MLRFLAGSCLLLIISGSCFAQNLSDFALKRGFGVRAAGMGGAYTAVAADGSAVFYNPAGLADPGFSYASGNPDTGQKNYDGSFSFFKLGFLGYGAFDLSTASGDRVSSTLLGFGNRSGFLNWGVNHKSSSWVQSGISNEGWATDIGFLVRITPQLKLGLVARDLLTSKNVLVPSSARMGLSFRPFDRELILAGDLEWYSSGLAYVQAGVEAAVAQGLTLRAGVDRGEATAGISLDFGAFSFDYAARNLSAGNTTYCLEAGLKILPRRERAFSILKPKEYALIDIRGAITGGRSEYSFLGGLRPGLDSILIQIRRAAGDKSIDGILVRLGGFSGGLGGMAVVEEIRSELFRARKSGKKIVAYIEGSALGDEYYLAAMADKIIAPPGTGVGGFGKSVEIYRTKGFFEKLGVEWRVFTQGKYKNAFDPYNAAMSEDQELMIKGLVSDLYRRMLTDIARDRKMGLEKIKSIGEGMVYSAGEAKELGLIDEIGYYKDARQVAAAILGEKEEEAEIIEPNLVEPEESFLTRVFGVAVIEIDGEIVSGSGGENIIFGGRYVGADKVVESIRKASDDVFVKAILLRINSPGGSSIASGEIYKALQYARKKSKVIIASIGNMGTSGGYYIAAGADKIVADPSSLTGSIGVIGYFPVYKKLMEKLEIKTEVIKEGKHADMFSGARQLSSEEASAIENLQAEAYDEFVRAVAAGRKLTTAEVYEAAQGRLYTGSQALELKLIDALGGFSDAVDLARKEARIVGEPRLIYYHEPSLFFNFSEGNVMNFLGINHF